MIIQVNFTAKWQLKNNPDYVWTVCKRLVNLRTGRIIKKTFNGKGCKQGYWIGKKFIKIEELKNLIELIPKKELPF
jgi:hypothetical protein